MNGEPQSTEFDIKLRWSRRWRYSSMTSFLLYRISCNACIHTERTC